MPHTAFRQKAQRSPRYWFKLLGVALVWGLFLFYVGYIGLWVYLMSEPARAPVCCTTPTERDFAYEDVTLTATDGVTLTGWYIPSQNSAAVIVLHGYGGNRMEIIDRATILAQHGYGVLLYDQRASGESGGDYRTFGWCEAEDVHVAVDFVVRQPDVDPDHLGILGFSQGGQSALRATADSDYIAAVVAEEPGFATIADLPQRLPLKEQVYVFTYRIGFIGLRWRTGVRAPGGVVEGLSHIPPRPTLFIATGPREEPGYWLVRHFYEQAGEPKTWWHVPEAQHGDVLVIHPTTYEENIVGFFDAALRLENN